MAIVELGGRALKRTVGRYLPHRPPKPTNVRAGDRRLKYIGAPYISPPAPTPTVAVRAAPQLEDRRFSAGRILKCNGGPLSFRPAARRGRKLKGVAIYPPKAPIPTLAPHTGSPPDERHVAGRGAGGSVQNGGPIYSSPGARPGDRGPPRRPPRRSRFPPPPRPADRHGRRGGGPGTKVQRVGPISPAPGPPPRRSRPPPAPRPDDRGPRRPSAAEIAVLTRTPIQTKAGG